MDKQNDYTWTDPARPVDYKESSVLKALKAGPLYVMPKADGVRMHFVFNGKGKVFIRSRANLPFPAMRDIEKSLNTPYWGFSGTLEAEAVLVLPDGNEAPCEVTSGALQAHRQLCTSNLHIYAFDSIGFSDGGRMDRLDAAPVEALALQGIIVARLWGNLCWSLEELHDVYKLHRGSGYEGSIAVPAGAPYCSGKKVGAGWKLKPDITVDGIVTKITEASTPEGFGKGIVGSFEVAYEDGTTGLCGAGTLTEDERRDVWERRADHLGRYVEVKAMERFAKGGLRHPNFNRWRDTEETKGVKQ